MKQRMRRLLSRLASPLAGRGYGGSRLVAPVISWWKRSMLPEYVVIDGCRLYLNPEDTGFTSISFQLAMHGFTEKSETELIRRYARPGMKVLDLGANIGYFTVLMSRLVGETGRVVAVEPDTKNLRLLERTVSELPVKNVEIVRGAVWEYTGMLDLYVSRENPGDHRTYPSDDDRVHYEVPCVAIDDLAGDRNFDLVKIDIQGAEGKALAGMRSLLERHPPRMILLEFWPSMLDIAGTPHGEVFQRLLGAGYSIRLIDERSDEPRPITLEEIEAICDLDWKFCNLLCLRSNEES